MANNNFPVALSTHGGSYSVGSPLIGTGANSIFIDYDDLDPNRGMRETVLSLVKTNKWMVWLKIKGAPSYDTVKSYCQLWKDSEISAYVAGAIGKDEPNQIRADGSQNITHSEYVSPNSLKNQKDAFKAVFPGLPFVLNLLVNGQMSTYFSIVQPDIAAIDRYLNGCDPCGCINNFDNLRVELSQLLKAFDDAGMKVENNQRVGIYFGTFKFNRCLAEWNAAGLPEYGNEMFGKYFQIVKEMLGSKWGWACFYAWKNDDSFDGLFPMNNADIRGPIQYLAKLIYDAELSTPWNLRVVATPIHEAGVTITKFYADNTILKNGASTTLRWDTLNYTSLSIDNGIGEVVGTSKVISPASTTVYTLTATGVSGIATAKTIVSVDVSESTALGLNSPSVIYANSKINVKILNQGTKVVTKARVWFNDGGPAYIDKSIFLKMDADGKGFIYSPDGFICDIGMFYLEFNGDSSDPLVVNFRQVAKPSITPSSIINDHGYGKYILNLVQSDNESIAGAVSSNTAVATVETTPGTTLNVSGIKTSGIYSITFMDGGKEQKVIVVAYDN